VGGQTDAAHSALEVRERRDTGQPGVRLPFTAHPHVRLHILGLPGQQHPDQMPFEVLALRLAADLGEPQSADPFLREADRDGHRLVDPAQPQPLVVDRRGAGGLFQERGRQGIAVGQRVPAVEGCDEEPVAAVAALGPLPVREQPYVPGAAVLMAQRELSAPAGARRLGPRGLAARGQQIRGGPTEDIGRSMAEQAPGALAPLDDDAVRVEDGPCRGGLVEGVVRTVGRWCVVVAPHRRHTPLRPLRTLTVISCVTWVPG
jgi:hypothetical protein